MEAVAKLRNCPICLLEDEIGSGPNQRQESESCLTYIKIHKEG